MIEKTSYNRNPFLKADIVIAFWKLKVMVAKFELSILFIYFLSLGVFF